jgi:hypothetical protein
MPAGRNGAQLPVLSVSGRAVHGGPEPARPPPLAVESAPVAQVRAGVVHELACTPGEGDHGLALGFDDLSADDEDHRA